MVLIKILSISKFMMIDGNTIREGQPMAELWMELKPPPFIFWAGIKSNVEMEDG